MKVELSKKELEMMVELLRAEIYSMTLAREDGWEQWVTEADALCRRLHNRYAPKVCGRKGCDICNSMICDAISVSQSKTEHQFEEYIDREYVPPDQVRDERVADGLAHQEKDDG